ncbi:uncharacterized protein K489DRAFT_377776 [Dissoconium aciculare CBS 342.82]|uniref:Zinc-ribbon 15 domain-containing protein n=1 Tax=Dissoconium aciculare CBS 342.82 TaxID=1314786 RepID=A0A6J3MB28_9PEZI|nr:uncharacterized protein K489DRAFT_377776 [Dissoconium aciculare CBS 342.82]KAF1825226.1 hypothetical protein K489DRAFT_377776 [Dissoconium aciculare CBS 342.82]
MAFCLMLGTHTFDSLLSGYENITVQCQNCGNFSGKLTKRWEWFTVCFVPLIPFSFKPYHDVSCHICHFHQDIGQRPDVQQQMNNPGSAPQQQHIPMQNGPPQGWGGQQKVQHPYYK